MKVYFTTTPRAKKVYGEQIKRIYSRIKDLGYTHTTDFILGVDVDKFYDADNREVEAYYRDTTRDLKRSDIVVLEMSMHSLAVGHLASLAQSLGKPVIALYTKGNTPFFLQGAGEEKLQLVEYTEETLDEHLKDALDYAAQAQDTRFNFFISPSHQNYLDWIARKKKVPRAVHLRRLLEKDMAGNKDYQHEVGVKGKSKK